MPVLNLNSIDIHTLVLGDSGPLMIMCHGLVSGSVATWYFKFAPALAQKYRVVLYDMRGHGNSAKPLTGYDLPTMARDLKAVINYYKTSFGLVDRSVNLVGHSYGALVALTYALAHPASVAALALLDAPLPAAHYIHPGMSNVNTSADVTALAAFFAHQLNIQGKRKRENFLRHLEFLYRQTSLKNDIAQSGDIPDDELSTLSMPVLSIYGRRSDCLAVGQRLSRLLDNIRFKTLNCGHFLTVEMPEQLSLELNDFFGVVA